MLHAAQIDVRGGAPEDAANNSGVAKQFVDGARQQFRMGAQTRELTGMADQGEPGAGEQTGQGLGQGHKRGLSHGDGSGFEDSFEFRGGCGRIGPQGGIGAFARWRQRRAGRDRRGGRRSAGSAPVTSMASARPHGRVNSLNRSTGRSVGKRRSAVRVSASRRGRHASRRDAESASSMAARCNNLPASSRVSGWISRFPLTGHRCGSRRAAHTSW